LLSAWYFVSINLKQYEYLSVREEGLYLEALCTKTDAPSIVYPNNPETPQQRKLIDWSRQLHLYYLPGDEEINAYMPISQKLAGESAEGTSSLEMTKAIHGTNKVGNEYIIDGFAFLEGIPTEHQQVYIGLKNAADNAPIFFTSGSIPRFDLEPYFHKDHLKDGGFRARIDANELQPGETTVWIKIIAGGQTKCIPTDNKITK
jgi:hypothetical protein